MKPQEIENAFQNLSEVETVPKWVNLLINCMKCLINDRDGRIDVLETTVEKFDKKASDLEERLEDNVGKINEKVAALEEKNRLLRIKTVGLTKSTN